MFAIFLVLIIGHSIRLAFRLTVEIGKILGALIAWTSRQIFEIGKTLVTVARYEIAKQRFPRHARSHPDTPSHP